MSSRIYELIFLGIWDNENLFFCFLPHIKHYTIYNIISVHEQEFDRNFMSEIGEERGDEHMIFKTILV